MCDVHTPQGELEALSALIARVNSSLDLDEVLEHATGVCTTLTGCAGALLYLWDEEQERLVIRGASDGYRHWIGEFSLALGEGLTGWTALNRSAGIIADDPLSDPRYKLVPELEDTRFQSVLTLPVVGHDEALVGVLTLHTTAPHEFADDDVRLLETVASLVAGAVENAKLHRRALRSVEVFRSLAELSRQLTSPAQSRERLQRLARTALELLDAAAVAVLRLDESRNRLAVETWVGGGRGGRTEGVRAEGLWSRLLGGGPVSVAVPLEDPLVRQLGLRPEPRSLFAAPLIFEGRPTGLIACYATERRSLGDENLALLGTIANHAAVALEEDRLRSAVDERAQVRALFDALRNGEPVSGADRLGLQLEEAHAVVVADVQGASDSGTFWPSVARAVDDVFPGSLTESRGDSLAALVPVRSEAWERLLDELLAGTLADTDPQGDLDAAAGFSDSTGRAGDYALAFRQAHMACSIARASRAGRRVRGFTTLGAQRYLWAISQERDPDPLELRVRELLEIDRTRGSELFRTLEAYLDNQGNAKRTAAALYVHRNTLRQRLARIRTAIELDPTDSAVWLDLALAVRLIRFRGLDVHAAHRSGANMS